MAKEKTTLAGAFYRESARSISVTLSTALEIFQNISSTSISLLLYHLVKAQKSPRETSLSLD
ncbi:MAG: hypothetical protein IJS96_03315 [Schwartzia sp.]|nr:hypothetical protein [Schwartzia sp. (in: firmicutes)]